jgi:NitT/TauT family transport system ATP-binding protein
MGELAISLAGVGKGFARRHGVTEALRGVDLEVGEGEFVAVIGPSGCGKSTLLRLIAGLIEPDAGDVRVAGLRPADARRTKWFGLVPQTPALLPWRTVVANIGLLNEVNVRSANGHLVPVDVGDLIEATGLRGFERALPGELSGGMQQRVGLARAFALGAPVLLMDEPFAALDEITREEMRFLLLDVWSRAGGQRTVVFVTHSIEEAVLLADRVVVLTPRPRRVAAEIAVELPRPRTAAQEDSDQFVIHLRKLRSALREGWQQDR